MLGSLLAAALGVWLGLSFRLHWALAYLIAVNGATFILYGYDKLSARAGRGWMRVPERALHLFAFAGGTPLAFVAQRLFRHKTVKGRFRIAFQAIAIVQACVVAWALWYWG